MEGPLFVKIENYEDMNNFLAQINKKILESKKILTEIDNIKKEEDLFIDKWKQGLAELEKKTTGINQMLYNVKY